MGLRFKEQIHGECFFVTTSFKERRRLGEIKGVYEAIAHSMRYCLKKFDASLLAYAFMPSHVHFVLVIAGERLGAFMRDFKKYTSQKPLPDITGHKGNIWAPRYDRVVIVSDRVLRTKIRYIHGNPVRARLTDRDVAWHWSSAGDYLEGRAGPIPIAKELL